MFNKANSNIYARFCLKSTVPVEDMVTWVSFEFSRLGGSKLYKKQNQAMETETPMMLLFVSNGTDPLSISADMTQMLESAYDSIEMDGMTPDEFDYMEILIFTLKLNAPQLPTQTKQAHKDYNHFKEQGIKAFHCKVAKDQVPFFASLRICPSSTARGEVFWEVCKVHRNPCQQCAIERLHKAPPFHAMSFELIPELKLSQY
jgi:hypothetical protein